jgi:hypothetical protein
MQAITYGLIQLSTTYSRAVKHFSLKKAFNTPWLPKNKPMPNLDSDEERWNGVKLNF